MFDERVLAARTCVRTILLALSLKETEVNHRASLRGKSLMISEKSDVETTNVLCGKCSKCAALIVFLHAQYCLEAKTTQKKHNEADERTDRDI